MMKSNFTVYLVAAIFGGTVMASGAPLSHAAVAQEKAAKNLTAELSTRETYVGQPIILRVEITNAKQYEPPRLPEIDGLDIRSGGTPSEISRISISNGRRTESSSITYTFQITPFREGEFKLPAIDIQIDGEVQSTGEFEFVVGKSETGDLLFVEVEGTDEKVYVGQPIKLALKIWIRPYSDKAHKVKLSEGNMWDRISRNTNWGEFKSRIDELSESRRRPGGEEVLRQDGDGKSRAYYFYQIDAMVYPQRPGQIDVGDVQVVVNYPTELAQSRGMSSMFGSAFDEPFFRRPNSLMVKSTRPIAATAEAPSIEVINVPIVGRPDDYRGAVGTYRITTMAQPLKVKAGDPLTFQIGLQGDGPMELVQAPPIASMQALTTNFKVADDTLAGYVQDDAKLFTTTIRPRTAGVSKIPAIPFSFFNPETEQYETAYSEPIAIEVEESASLSLDSIVGNTNGLDRQRERPKGVASTTAVSKPILVNFSSEVVLKDNDQHARPSKFSIPWLPLAMPPILFFVCLVFTRRDWLVAPFRSGNLPRLATARISKAESVAEIVAAIESTFCFEDGTSRHSLPLAIQEVLAKCDQVTFSPLKSDSLEGLKIKAVAAVNSFDAATNNPNVRQRLVTRMFLMVFILILPLLGQQVGADELPTLDVDQQRLVLSEANELYSQAMELRATDSAEAKQLLELAIRKFELLASSGMRTGKLFFNLGNAYLQIDNLGLAVANFEQAHRFDPSDAAMKTNLQFARQQLAGSKASGSSTVVNTFNWSQIRDFVSGLNHRLSTDLTWWISVLAWSTIWLVLLARFFPPLSDVIDGLPSQLSLVRSSRTILISSIVFLIAAGSYTWSMKSESPFDGVAIVESADLHQADGSEFPVVGEIAAGERIRLLDQRGKWAKIQSTVTNDSGWVAMNQIYLLRG